MGKEAMGSYPKSIRCGNIIQFRNKKHGMIFRSNDKYFILFVKNGENTTRDVKARYTKELLHLFDKEWDIMKVCSASGNPSANWPEVMKSPGRYDYEIVFARKEKFISMAELADLLDCKIEEIVITK